MSDEEDPTGTEWSDQEIDLIVADYFAMLKAELAGQKYVKTHHNAALRQLLRRSEGSVEFKHQNISAVLERLGMPRINGYKPAWNFQGALIEGVGRYLAVQPTWRDMHLPDLLPGLLTPAEAQPALIQLAEESSIFLESPPERFPDTQVKSETARYALERLARKFDPAARDARNRSLGRLGEARILRLEQETLTAQGRMDLAKKVRWISQDEGDGAGFDIHSFDASGRDRFVEVKTTTGTRFTPFFLSENERSFAEERPEEFRLVRLYDFASSPRAFELAPPLGDFVTLEPLNYRADFKSRLS